MIEIEKKAEEYEKGYKDGNEQGYKDGKEDLTMIERKSEELKAQIEKMKNCENCKLYDCTVDCKHTKCKYQYSKMCRAENMIDKWELAE